jgi:hypothetical protein
MPGMATLERGQQRPTEGITHLVCTLTPAAAPCHPHDAQSPAAPQLQLAAQPAAAQLPLPVAAVPWPGRRGASVHELTAAAGSGVFGRRGRRSHPHHSCTSLQKQTTAERAALHMQWYLSWLGLSAAAMFAAHKFQAARSCLCCCCSRSKVAVKLSNCCHVGLRPAVHFAWAVNVPPGSRGA